MTVQYMMIKDIKGCNMIQEKAVFPHDAINNVVRYKSRKYHCGCWEMEPYLPPKNIIKIPGEVLRQQVIKEHR